MVAKGPIEVEVAHATPERQRVVRLTVQAPCTAERAVRESGILAEFSGLEVVRGRLGVFGELVEPDHLLEHGDRVELYRPLVRDPKTARRERARAQAARHRRRGVKG